jgi:hypothetical protein
MIVFVVQPDELAEWVALLTICMVIGGCLGKLNRVIRDLALYKL